MWIIGLVMPPENLPADIAALQAGLVAERAKRIEEAARAARIEAELAVAKAKASDDKALIAYQRLQIAKLTRQLYGQRSERSVRLLEETELAFEELESSATEDEIAAEGPWPRPRMWWLLPANALRVSPSPSICRAIGWSSPGRRLPVPRQRAAAQIGRGHHRDAGGDPAAVEGDPACP